VCYDGSWFRKAARYFACARGAQLRVAGLHDVIRWHAAGVFRCPVRQVAITCAHYVAGRDPGTAPDGWEQMLADHGITRHDVPITSAKGEVGADVEFALTAHQIAVDASPDMIALIAGDGDFGPLASRLASRGVRVLVPVANISYTAGQRTITVTSSGFLTRRATDTPSLTSLIDAAAAPSYPPHLQQPLAVDATGNPDPSAAADAARFTGTVTRWDRGSSHGFITSGNQTWYAAASDSPDRQPLPSGTPVTFTGHPVAPAGKAHPRARNISPQPAELPPATTPSPHATGTGSRPAGRNSPAYIAIDSAALTRLRTGRGLTVGALARAATLSTTTIKRLERAANPRCYQDTITQLAAALGASPAAFTKTPPARGDDASPDQRTAEPAS
jgi:NYN domain/Helix-turn-helix domain